MSTETEKFEAVENYLWKCTADFCLFYSEKKEEGSALKWRRATSLRFKSEEVTQKFVDKYHPFVTQCYKLKRDKVFEEVIDPRNGAVTPIGPVVGKLLRFFKALPATEANSIGQRWWQLVIASGSTHNAGCVIMARVAAKNREEVRKYITDIQAIMGDEILGDSQN